MRWLGSGVGAGLLYLASAAATVAAADASAVTIADSRQFTLHSAATGRDYLIQVAVPRQPPPPSGYAVLYVLDGNAYWPLLRLAHRMFSRHGPQAQPQPLLIVGVGYPDVAMYDYTARADDYTPLVPGFKPRHPEREIGGAAKFLSFVREQLQPAIKTRFTVDAEARAIIGHSFGGLFVLYTLLTAPDTFDRYVAISPSLWWGQGNLGYYMAAGRHRTVATTDARKPACLFIGVGGGERRGRRGQNMPDHARGFVHDVQQLYPAVDSRLVIFEGERHGTVMWPAVRRALQFLDHC